LSIADDVTSAGRVLLQNETEEIRKIRDVDRRPMLLSGAEHDQIARVVSGRSEEHSRNPSFPAAVRHAWSDQDSAHVLGGEHSPLDLLLPRHERRRIDW
jgi:hypothetical protein